MVKRGGKGGGGRKDYGRREEETVGGGEVHKYMYLPVSKVYAGSVRVSVIHQTLIWTTGSLTCIHDPSYACVYTQRLGTPTIIERVSTTFLTRKNSH